MATKTRNSNYDDFSNRNPYNGIPCRPGQVLVPVVADEEMTTTLKPYGLIWDNLESWTFPRSAEKVPVAFIQVEESEKEAAMRDFNGQAHRYLCRFKKTAEDDHLSLEKFAEDAESEDGEGYDPTGSTRNEDDAFTLLVVDMLVEDLNKQDPLYGQIFRMLFDGDKKKDILNEVDLGREKSQGYAFIKKVQEEAAKLYNKSYR